MKYRKWAPSAGGRGPLEPAAEAAALLFYYRIRLSGLFSSGWTCLTEGRGSGYRAGLGAPPLRGAEERELASPGRRSLRGVDLGGRLDCTRHGERRTSVGWALLMHAILHSAAWALPVPTKGSVGQISVKITVIFCLSLFHWLGISRPCLPGGLPYHIFSERKLGLFPLGVPAVLSLDPVRTVADP